MKNGGDPHLTGQSYLDFELEIAPGGGREYPIAVIRSPAGEARETMHFPFDELALESRLDKLQIALLRSGEQRRIIPSLEERTVQNFGRDLFNALFVGDVRSRYDVSQREATQQGKGLRLKLRIESPELAALPWEFLFDSRQAEYLCLSRNTPVVRYLELPQPIMPLTVAPPLRILGMVANPRNLCELDVTREKQRVENATKDLHQLGMVELTWLDGQTWRDLQRTMRYGPWHVFHFIGHGGFDSNADEGLITLADDQGLSHNLTATQLGRLLADHRSLRLVLLNACEGARGGKLDVFSSTASILVQRGIPAVLAMQYEITDRAAIELARAFYEALADEMPVDAAVTEARKAVSLAVNNTVEWGTPVLYMRSPDGVLFSIRQPRSSKQDEAEQQAELAVQKAKVERLERERREREKVAQEVAARKAREEAESKAREEAAQHEAERQAKLAAERAEAERIERERQEREAQEKATRNGPERQVRLAAEKVEAERLEQERRKREAHIQAAREAERKVSEEAAQREAKQQAKLAAENAEAERLEPERRQREAYAKDAAEAKQRDAREQARLLAKEAETRQLGSELTAKLGWLEKVTKGRFGLTWVVAGIAVVCVLLGGGTAAALILSGALRGGGGQVSPTPTPVELQVLPTVTAVIVPTPLSTAVIQEPTQTLIPTPQPTLTPSPVPTLSRRPTVPAVTATRAPVLPRPTPTVVCTGGRVWNGVECVCPQDKPDFLAGQCVPKSEGGGNEPPVPPR